MSALDMTAVALFPHRLKGAMGSMDPSLATVIVMWWVMMIAMMTPSAAPLVMLYRRVLRQRGVDGAGSAFTSLSLLAGSGRMARVLDRRGAASGDAAAGRADLPR